MDHAAHCVVVLYDSITNSVFESQVAQPFSERYPEYSSITLVSFEQKNCDALINKLQEKYSKLNFVVYKRSRFFGKASLLLCALKLRLILRTFVDYDLYARGPHAGLIAQWARTKNCKKLTVQARGLLAQEYVYAKKFNAKINVSRAYNFFLRIFIALRAGQYYRLEKHAYTMRDCSIEAVSPALKEYLLREYGAVANSISIAEKDIPVTIQSEQKKQWLYEIRKHLGIGDNYSVYCYNGSAKPWQCADETIDYFRNLTTSEKFLLILTQEPESFKLLLVDAGIQPTHYALITVENSVVLYKYLSACDYGLVFRANHIVNWVSRPTKVLEYQAAGLKIIHNNTIAILC